MKVLVEVDKIGELGLEFFADNSDASFQCWATGHFRGLRQAKETVVRNSPPRAE